MYGLDPLLLSAIVLLMYDVDCMKLGSNRPWNLLYKIRVGPPGKLQIARFRKRKKGLSLVQRLERANVHGFQQLFHDRDLIKMSEKCSNHAPVHNFQLGKRNSTVPAKLTAEW